MLIVEFTEMVPSAELYGAGEFVLVVLVKALSENQRGVAEAELKSVFIAYLRITCAIWTCGVAIVDRCRQSRPAIGIDGQSDARRRKRI